tara:strand:- start:232 stop:459 length:228 start_codon:yes stop_codon:yes gene_type:complete
MKYLNLILVSIFFQSCSYDFDAKYWNEHNDIKIDNQKRLIKIINKSNDIVSMSIDEYKIYIDDYIKKSKFPDISK